MSIRPSLVPLVPLGLVLVLAGSPLPLRADPVVLAAEDFDSEALGATAKPGGPTTVSGEVYDDSTSSSCGVSEVVASGTGRAYEVSHDSSQPGRRGIRMPFSESVASGQVRLSAVISAAQEDGGAVLSCSRPEGSDWLACAGFGPDGVFTAHGQATTVSYSSGTSYRVDMALNLGSSPTVDYTVTDLSTDGVVYSGTFDVDSGVSAGEIHFTTVGTAAGSFTIDDVLATR